MPLHLCQHAARGGIHLHFPAARRKCGRCYAQGSVAAHGCVTARTGTTAHAGATLHAGARRTAESPTRRTAASAPHHSHRAMVRRHKRCRAQVLSAHAHTTRCGQDVCSAVAVGRQLMHK